MPHGYGCYIVIRPFRRRHQTTAGLAGKADMEFPPEAETAILFVRYNPDFFNEWFALDGNNDYHLRQNSAADGHGITPPPAWTNPYFGGATLPGDPNIGALGVSVTAAVDKGHAQQISSFALEQNYPNPFNPSTVITFDLPERSHVRLTVYDVTGRVVAELFNGERGAGHYSQVWNAGNVASGMYFFRLEAGQFHATRRMMLVR